MFMKNADGSARHPCAPLHGFSYGGPVRAGRFTLGHWEHEGALHPRRRNRPHHGFRGGGRLPAFGNDDDRVDAIACEQAEAFYNAAGRPCAVSRGAEATLSGADDHLQRGTVKTAPRPTAQSGAAFDPGANPMHGKKRRAGLAELPVAFRTGTARTASPIHFPSCRERWAGRTSSAGPISSVSRRPFFPDGPQHQRQRAQP